VERIVAGRLASREALTLAAREISRQGDEFVYELEILGADGALCERWEGLRLRAVDRVPAPPAWSAALLTSWVERRLQEIFPASGVRVALERTALDPSGQRESAPTVTRLLGGATLRHRPDGRPEAESGEQVSVAHAGALVLAVARDGRIGCDLETVSERTPEAWRDLLGDERHRLAELIGRERGETPAAAATRVWTALESLRKAGAAHDAPLTLDLDPLDQAVDDGWLLLRSGALRIATLLAPVRELSGDAALAVLVES
jgi:enediyne polyketide synthase